MDCKLHIVFEDEEILVVNKPSGLPAVPGKDEALQDCIVSRARAYCPTMPVYCAAHRLDMDTSGLMILAKNEVCLRQLFRQFSEREVYKEYEALIEGAPLALRQGCIELSFRLDIEHRPYQIYDPVHGKLGITEWQLLGEAAPGIWRMRLIPFTGRTHQLRLHMAHELGLGRPIVGDRLYGNGKGPGELKLHAKVLRLKHPANGQVLNFYSAPPF